MSNKANVETRKVETNKQEPPKDLDISEMKVVTPEGGIYDDYANILNVDWTLYDVRLRFAYLHYTIDPDNPTVRNQVGVVEDRAAITIPWHQAKILRDVLASVVKSYEDVNGELKPLQLPRTP